MSEELSDEAREFMRRAAVFCDDYKLLPTGEMHATGYVIRDRYDLMMHSLQMLRNYCEETGRTDLVPLSPDAEAAREWHRENKEMFRVE